MVVNATLSSQFHRKVDSALKLGQPQEDPAAKPTAVEAAARSFAETLRMGEVTAMEGLAGRADPQSVVTAISSAELAVQSAVVIRDRVVESYQEILRMPV